MGSPRYCSDTTRWAARVRAGHSSQRVGASGPAARNVSSLRLAWAGRTGQSVRSSPAVAGGLVYVSAEDGRLYAFDSASGALRWQVRLGG